eukprot:scaffold624_cov402-Prasinococcus_capsulatus_cf.AAC.6
MIWATPRARSAISSRSLSQKIAPTTRCRRQGPVCLPMLTESTNQASANIMMRKVYCSPFSILSFSRTSVSDSSCWTRPASFTTSSICFSLWKRGGAGVVMRVVLTTRQGDSAVVYLAKRAMSAIRSSSSFELMLLFSPSSADALQRKMLDSVLLLLRASCQRLPCLLLLLQLSLVSLPANHSLLRDAAVVRLARGAAAAAGWADRVGSAVLVGSAIVRAAGGSRWTSSACRLTAHAASGDLRTSTTAAIRRARP